MKKNRIKAVLTGLAVLLLGGCFLMSRNRENESFRIVAEGPAKMAEERKA